VPPDVRFAPLSDILRMRSSSQEQTFIQRAAVKWQAEPRYLGPFLCYALVFSIKISCPKTAAPQMHIAPAPPDRENARC
jgi:hypothetical protein